jgi:hypothetical protein|tara:strand:+ start:189 stop:527 length:339 start_codon:yes stop_codon:yes gene_type:complete
MDEQIELWMDRIRKLAPVIEKAEYELIVAEADVKKINAKLKMKALSEGFKTTSAQETYAENQDELYQARLKVGVAKGFVSSVKLQIKALEVGFEEWRTKMVNEREERKRYGA